MAREHRDLKDGDLTITPFTPEEEAIADQQDADRLAAETLYNSDDERIGRSFTPTDKDRVIFEAFFEMINRIINLEGGTVVNRTQLKTWLKNKLP